MRKIKLENILQRLRGLETGHKVLDYLLSHADINQALRIIFTPENMRALGEGFGEGLAKGAKHN